MTTILLSIIIVLLIARFALQVWQARNITDGYSTTYEVQKAVVCEKSLYKLGFRLCNKWEYCDFELISVIKDGDAYYAFLQQKKIKHNSNK